MSTLSATCKPTPDLVLANPTAGAGRARNALAPLKKFAAEHGWNVEVRSTASATELAEIARDEASRGRDRIFALGGDGTFQALLNAVRGHASVSLGVLPAGGGNDLATALRLPRHPVEAAEAILSRGELSCLDAALVRTADGVERLYMGGGGVGLDADAARFANGVYRRLRGRRRYLLSAIRALIKFQALNVRVILDDEGDKFLESRALVLGVLNTPNYGAGLRLAPEARLDDGKLDLVLLEDLSLLEVLRILPGLAISGQAHTPRIRRHCVSRVRIETDRPCVFHGDGEIIGQTPVEIDIVPRAMRVWRPALTPAPSADRG